MENVQLNIRLKEGNPAAYEELFKQTFPRMLGYCKLFIHDQGQANDLVAEELGISVKAVEKPISNIQYSL